MNLLFPNLARRVYFQASFRVVGNLFSFKNEIEFFFSFSDKGKIVSFNSEKNNGVLFKSTDIFNFLLVC